VSLLLTQAREGAYSETKVFLRFLHISPKGEYLSQADSATIIRASAGLKPEGETSKPVWARMPPATP
jgi:hypothetical protein